jgi:5-methylcytosine-specific restriction endonuclease McrA
MAREFAKQFYRSKQWRQCRAKYIITKFNICERCGASGLIVHHKKYITQDNINDYYILFDYSNLELLCKDCHNKEHHGADDVDDSDIYFDSNGNICSKS